MAGLELPTLSATAAQLIPALIIAAFIYGLIFVIRWCLEQAPWQWTNRIGPRLGPVLWVSLAFVVACCFTFTFRLNLVGEIFSFGHMEFPQAWMGYLATAAGISASSNLAHFLLRPLRKKYKNLKTGKTVLLPEGQDLPAESSQGLSPQTKYAAEQTEVVVSDTPVAHDAQRPARLFREVHPAKPGYHVWVDGSLHALETNTDATA